MVNTNRTIWISVYRSPRVKAILLSVLIINFINLSVNFTERNLELDDPVDTVSEMIFEWCLNGDAEAIPDNGTEQEDQQLKPMKIFIDGTLDFSLKVEPSIFSQNEDFYSSHFTPIFLSLNSPPPDLD